jgi:hypothetical protein
MREIFTLKGLPSILVPSRVSMTSLTTLSDENVMNIKPHEHQISLSYTTLASKTFTCYMRNGNKRLLLACHGKFPTNNFIIRTNDLEVDWNVNYLVFPMICKGYSNGV